MALWWGPDTLAQLPHVRQAWGFVGFPLVVLQGMMGLGCRVWVKHGGFVWLLLVMVLGVGGLWAVWTACLQCPSSPTSCRADLDLLGSHAGCDVKPRPDRAMSSA